MRPLLKRLIMSGWLWLAGSPLVWADGLGGEDAYVFPTSGDYSFSPTVTREESRLLNEAVDLSRTDPAGAIGLLRSLEEPERASAAIDFAIGNFHVQDHRLSEAEAAYLVALKKTPKFRGAIKNLGRVYLMRDQFDEAIALYQGLVADGAADADILSLTGHALLTRGYPVSAESAYRQSLLMRQRNPDAMLGLAKALMVQERYAEGLAMVNEILKEDPTNLELWELRANAYLATDDNDAVIRSIETARRLGCSDPELLATLGDLYLNREQPEDALRAYEVCFSAGAVNASRLLRAVEGFLMFDELENAEKMVARADVEHSGLNQKERVRLARLKAEIALRRDEPDVAMALCEEVLAFDPLDGGTLLLLAEIEQGRGLLERAVMTCERAARIPGFEVEALIRQARVEVERENYAEAVTVLEAAQTFKDQPHVGRYLEQLRRMAAH